MLAYRLFKASRSRTLLYSANQTIWQNSSTLCVPQGRLFATKVSSDEEIANFHNVEGSTSTPFDDDYYEADKIPDEEHDAILGLSEFEKSVNLFHEKKYDESEVLLKEALKILKNAQQEKSMGYLYLLKRLAYTCFVNRKFADSEKFFQICAD